MDSGAVNNLKVIMKQMTKFDSRRVDEFLEGGSKFCASFTVYNNTTPNVL